MPATPFDFRGEQLLLDPAGVLVWPRLSLLAVADLHFEKGSAAARQGQLVPPWDSGLTLARLAGAVARYAPATVVAVGDSFHDTQAAARLSAADHTTLAGLAARARFVWVQGNHDPHPPAGLEGESTPAYAVGPLVFRHQARATASGEVSGHFHPKARIATRAADVCRPCFMVDADRIMLPSFGAYTGGLDVRSDAIARHFPNGGRAFLLGESRVFCFAVPPPGPAAPALAPCAPALAVAAPAHTLAQ